MLCICFFLFKKGRQWGIKIKKPPEGGIKYIKKFVIFILTRMENKH